MKIFLIISIILFTIGSIVNHITEKRENEKISDNSNNNININNRNK